MFFNGLIYPKYTVRLRVQRNHLLELIVINNVNLLRKWLDLYLEDKRIVSDDFFYNMI